MRALGPGSVASLLKIALDVAYLLLWLFAGLIGLAAIGALFAPLDDRTLVYEVGGAARNIPLARTLVVGALSLVACYAAAFGLILMRLRKVFATLTAGDPFQPENTRRFTQIGLILAIITVGQFLAQLMAAMATNGVVPRPNPIDLMTPGFAVLVVFVLAEVFREGARLRRDAELTI